MKQKKVVLTIVACAVILPILIWVVGCGAQESKPSVELKELFVAFYEAVDQQNWEEVKKYLAKDVIKLAEENDEIESFLLAFKKQLIQDEQSIQDIEVIEEEIEEDKLTLQFDGKIYRVTIWLRHENGNWRIEGVSKIDLDQLIPKTNTKYEPSE